MRPENDINVLLEKVVTFPWILHSTKTQSIFLFSLSKSLQTKCAVDSSYSAWKCGANVNEMRFVMALGFGSSRIFVGKFHPLMQKMQLSIIEVDLFTWFEVNVRNTLSRL